MSCLCFCFPSLCFLLLCLYDVRSTCLMFTCMTSFYSLYYGIPYGSFPAHVALAFNARTKLSEAIKLTSRRHMPILALIIADDAALHRPGKGKPVQMTMGSMSEMRGTNREKSPVLRETSMWLVDRIACQSCPHHF